MAAGVGIRGEIGLGAFFPDTDGYRMFGVGGEVSAAAKLKVDVFMGYKEDGSAFRIVLGAPPGIACEIEFKHAFEEPGKVIRALGPHSVAQALTKIAHLVCN